MIASLCLSSFTFYRQRHLPARPVARFTVDGPVPPGALQKVGVVRFNPYHDTGGDYSFAVALLDAGGSGVVLSGLYHRDRCRVYAKPVREWQSQYTLTDEELKAVSQARGSNL